MVLTSALGSKSALARQHLEIEVVLSIAPFDPMTPITLNPHPHCNLNLVVEKDKEQPIHISHFRHPSFCSLPFALSLFSKLHIYIPFLLVTKDSPTAAYLLVYTIHSFLRPLSSSPFFSWDFCTKTSLPGRIYRQAGSCESSGLLSASSSQAKWNLTQPWERSLAKHDALTRFFFRLHITTLWFWGHIYPGCTMNYKCLELIFFT